MRLNGIRVRPLELLEPLTKNLRIQLKLNERTNERTNFSLSALCEIISENLTK